MKLTCKVNPTERKKMTSWFTHLEGEAEGELVPVVSLLSHLEQLSLKATPLQLIQLVVTLDHTVKRPFEREHLVTFCIFAQLAY